MERNPEMDDEAIDEEDLVEIEPDTIQEEGEELEGLEEGEAEGDEDLGDDAMSEEEAIEDQAYFTFRNHSDSVYCVAVHPTIPNLILTGGVDDKAFLWLVPRVATHSTDGAGATEEVVCTEIVGHTDTVTSVGFNFNGSQFLTGSYDGTVRIHSLETREHLITLEGPEDIEWASWHTRGNAVIAGSKDATVWLWLSHNGQCMQVFTGHAGLVNCGGFTHDGKMIVTGSEDNSMRVWMPKTGACKKVFDAPQASVTCLAFGEDTVLAGCEDGRALLHSLSSLRLLHVLVHAEDVSEDSEDSGSTAVECVGFSTAASGLRFMSTGGMNNELKIWDFSTGACRCTCVHEGGVVALQWHPTLLAVCSAGLDRNVCIWDGRNGALLMRFTGHMDSVTNFTFASLLLGEHIGEQLQSNPNDPNAVVTVSEDGTSKAFLVPFATLIR